MLQVSAQGTASLPPSVVSSRGDDRHRPSLNDPRIWTLQISEIRFRSNDCRNPTESSPTTRFGRIVRARFCPWERSYWTCSSRAGCPDAVNKQSTSVVTFLWSRSRPTGTLFLLCAPLSVPLSRPYVRIFLAELQQRFSLSIQ